MENQLLNSSIIMDNVTEALNMVEEEKYAACNMLIAEGINTQGRKFQVHINVTFDERMFINNTGEDQVKTYHVDENNRLIESPKYTNEEYLDLHGSAENAYLKNKITTQEYFKLDEQKRVLYMRFCGNEEVYYILNPAPKK